MFKTSESVLRPNISDGSEVIGGSRFKRCCCRKLGKVDLMEKVGRSKEVQMICYEVRILQNSRNSSIGFKFFVRR